MSTEILIVLLAIPIGIIAGMMPGVSTTVILLLTFPLIYNLPFDLIFAFYISVAICTQFSSSVIAIYAGIPGDITVLPVLKERNNLLKEFSIKENLYRTAVASAIGTCIGFSLLVAFVYFLGPYSIFLLRSEVLFSIILIVLVVCLFWQKNKILINFLLVPIGILIGTIGFNNLLLKDFFTFGNPILYGGIPVLPAFIALYAFPNLIKLNKDKKSFIVEQPPMNSDKKNKIMSSSILGGSVGSFSGLVPILGSVSSSNIAYWISGSFKFSSLEKVAASEASNSAAFVVVLAPLLLFGIAIIPSEVILLEMLSSRGWTINFVTKETLLVLFFISSISVILGYYACTTLAKHMVTFIINTGQWLIWCFFLTLLINVYILSSYTSEVEIYFTVFFICVFLSIFFENKKIDPLPLIFPWAIAEQLIAVTYRMKDLHF